MEYVLLKHVHEHSQEWTIKVRVTRISMYQDQHDPSKILRLNFVLLDEEGATMDAEIPEEWVSTFATRMNEGTIYYIRYFRVVQAKNLYRAVDRPIMARFTRYTKISELGPQPLQFPRYACSLVTFQTLRERDNNNTLCSDIIGVFTGCTHVRLQTTRGGPKKLRNVYLSNDTESVSIALWGPHAEEFAADEFMQVAAQRPLIFLFVGLTGRIFKESISLQGSLICKWFVEPDLPQVHALRETFIALNGSTAQPIWHGSGLPAPEAEQTTVADLAAVTNPHTIYSKKYVVNVKVKCLKPNEQWWYHACSVCNRHAILEGDVYRCSFRKCDSTRGGPRYRLMLIAIEPESSLQDDHVPSIQLAIFGPKAEEVLGTPVHNLISMQSGIGLFLPSKITDLYGREFQVRISLSPSSLDRKDISFQVNSIHATPTISAGAQSRMGVVPEKLKSASSLTHADKTTAAERQSSPSFPQHQEQKETCSADKGLAADEECVSPDKHQAITCTPPPQQTPISVEETGPAQDISHDPGSQTKEHTSPCEQQDDATKSGDNLDKALETIHMPEHQKCTPPPQPTPSSVKKKVYKRSRSEDVTGTSSDDDSSPIVSAGKEKSRAVKRLKFDVPAKEK